MWSPANAAGLKILVAGVALLGASRPAAALLVLAAVAPFGRLVSTALSPGGPVEITEALALAYLAGWMWSRLRHGVDQGQTSPGLLLAYLFAAAVVASLIVDIGIYRYWRDYWYPFLGQLVTYLARDFLSAGLESRPWAATFGLPAAQAAAIFLEGVALTRAAHVLCAGHAAFGRRLLLTLAIAAVGTAVLSAGMALQAAGAGDRSLLSVYQHERIAAHVTKVNTAASSFVLFIPVVVGLTVWSMRFRPRSAPVRVLCGLAAVVGLGLLFGALLLTSTRAAMIAGIVIIAGTALYALAAGSRVRQMTRRSVVAIVAASIAVAALLGHELYSRTAALEAASLTQFSLPVRVLMWRAALRTLAAQPVFGVGIGQFQYRVAEFDPSAALPANVGLSRFNAHNQFLEMTAELGVIGGLLFVGMFAVILWRAWKAFRANHDPLLGGAIAGVTAFLITCLAGQPLLYDVVAVPFWLVLGVLLAAGDAAPAASLRLPPAARQFRSRMIAVFLVLLALSIPVRVWRGKSQVNLALADYGFSDWYRPAGESPYRLVRDEGTFFTYPRATRLKLPIRRDTETGQNRLEVDVSLDGRRARTLTLADDEWRSVEFIIPFDAKRRFRRIDLAVRAPAGVAAQVRVAPAEIREDETRDPAQTNLRPVLWDLTGDRKSDILWRHAARGEVWVWPMDGATRLTETNVGTVADTDWAIRGVADQNGDGKVDILWRHAPTGMIYYWPMDGSTRLSETYVATVDPAYDIVGTGDYNGDGKADILWRHRTNGELWVWLMDGATRVSMRHVDTVDPGHVVKGSGDLNGDGKADIVWHHATRGDVWVWLMNGTTRVSQTWVGTVPDVGYQIVGVADHTGEGNADLLWHHATRGEVWLWAMDATTRVTEKKVALMPDTGYRVAGTGDYDGDGKADLLWHHATRGEVWLWAMNGATRLSETKVATVPDVGYQIIK